MKITSLVENTSRVSLPVEHGLSLHIALADGRNVLFDMGQGVLFHENAERLGVKIEEVDVAIVSHGHYDHGGGLVTFLRSNGKASVYLHSKAFEPHYSLRPTGLRYIGLDATLLGEQRLIRCGEEHRVDPSMLLFAGVAGDCCLPTGNRLLFGPDANAHDTFRHEQNLVVEEGGHAVLVAGCAHCGIVNIMRRAEALMGRAPTHVLAGMHLVKSGLAPEEEEAFTKRLAHELMNYTNTQFYTMHCTGELAYERLRRLMGGQMEYLACGDTIAIA